MDETTFPVGDTDPDNATDRDSRTPPDQVAENPADADDADEWLPL
jgi:hypothetical protein